ncbi:MAG TPA: hypothetical protein VK595_04855, partial [Vicinamibacterales bacterium]|nr:hypothetical protein [Vicinamibacterales bacterium]
MIHRLATVATLVTLVLAGSRAPQARQPQTVPPFELDEATVADLQAAMASGRYTSRRLVELYSERIKAIDRSGPTLRAVIEMNPDAGSIADRLDDERRAGR